MNNGRVIIADDDEDDRMLVLSAFNDARADIEIEFALDGCEVLKQLRAYIGRELPVFVLLDLNMPRMDGMEALIEIKKDKDLCKIPVIIFTTAKNEKEIRKCYEMGASSYVVKPDSFVVLRKLISDLCHYWLDTATLAH